MALPRVANEEYMEC